MATLYKYHTNETGDSELFRCGINVLPSVRLNFLDDLLKDGSLAIITELGMQSNETVQFFLTFDDVINWYYFGKGLGNMSITGLIFAAVPGSTGLATLLNTTMKNLRGQRVAASIGNATFTCVLTNFTLQLTQDPAPVITFVLNLAIIDNTLPKSVQRNESCNDLASFLKENSTPIIEGSPASLRSNEANA